LWQSKHPSRPQSLARTRMYLEYYGLEQPPFSITPDPHYVFLSEHHRDALAHLLYGIRQGGGGGFVQLTGEVGTGKTTLSRLLLHQLPENTHAALVLNPRLDPIELLDTICEELRLKPGSAAVDATTEAPIDVIDLPEAPSAHRKKNGRGKTSAKTAAAKPATKQSSKQVAKPNAKPSAKALYDLLSAYLLQAYARGERVVLIIDEAQNLSTEALEQVRLLTNLETDTQKLLQIILIGQPELREMLMRPELRQLAQRITARYHLRPLDEAGTAAYLRHRLNTAGASRFPFSQDAVRRLHRRSGGVPRLINVVAERALLGGYAHDLLIIDAKTIDRAANEALAPSFTQTSLHRRLIWQAAGLGIVVACFSALLMFWPGANTDAARDEGTTSKEASQTASQSRLPAGPQPLPQTPSTAAASTSGLMRPANVANESGIEPLLQHLRTAPPHANEEWTSLLKVWKAPAMLSKTSVDACPAVLTAGWRCLRSRASLDQLLRFDRQVLLRLRAEPHATWARLIGTDGERVRLALGDSPTDSKRSAQQTSKTRNLDIDRVALAGVWNGEFLAIWPAPEALETRYASGDANALAWVHERLQRDREDAVAIQKINAQDVDTALRRFQTRYGLVGDGRMRADTEFALATRNAGPRLMHAATDPSAE
jgi:general secretion pathway protein A